MPTFEPSFIPLSQLPTLTLAPDTEIVLGTTLKDPRDVRKPLRKEPLVAIPESDIYRDREPKTWRWNSEDHISKSVKFWAKLASQFPGYGAGSEASVDTSTSEAMIIESDSVKAQHFSPDDGYFENLANQTPVKMYANKKWPMHPRVYFVTAILIAERATFEITKGRNKGRKANVSFEASESATAGAEMADSGTSNSGLNCTVTEPFVLAVELRTLKVKGDGSFSEENSTKHRKFDDRVSAESFSDIWEVDTAVAEDLWQD